MLARARSASTTEGLILSVCLTGSSRLRTQSSSLCKPYFYLLHHGPKSTSSANEASCCGFVYLVNFTHLSL